jgi:hypothetical protein
MNTNNTNNTKNSVNIFKEIYYDNIQQDYFYILTLSSMPAGPLKNYTKLFHVTNPSTKILKSRENYCAFVITRNIFNEQIHDHQNNIRANICTIEDFTYIYDYLMLNNYTINDDLTKIFSNNYSYNNIISMNNHTSSGNKAFLLSVQYTNPIP